MNLDLPSLALVLACRAKSSLSGHIAAACLGSFLFASVSQAAPPNDASTWQRVKHAASVPQGAKSPQHLLYMITDANCPFCHDLWLALQPKYAAGLQVRYVMVGVLASDSTGKAAAILEASEPSVALTRNERQWAKLPDDLGGGIRPMDNPKPATVEAIRANEQLMRDLGIRGTPALIYRSTDGAVHIEQGAFPDGKLKSIIAAASAD